MDLFEKQAQLQSLFQTSPVDAAYAQGTPTGRRIAGKYQDLDVALLLLQRVNASEFFDYQVYFVSELSKTLEIEGIRSDDVARRKLADAGHQRVRFVDHPDFADTGEAIVGRQLQEGELTPRGSDDGRARPDNFQRSPSSVAGNGCHVRLPAPTAAASD